MTNIVFDAFVTAIGQSDAATMADHFERTAMLVMGIKHKCPHDWRYSAGTHVSVSEDYPFRYCVICGRLVVDNEVRLEGSYPYA